MPVTVDIANQDEDYIHRAWRKVKADDCIIIDCLEGHCIELGSRVPAGRLWQICARCIEMELFGTLSWGMIGKDGADGVSCHELVQR